MSPSHQLSAEIIYYTDASVSAQTAQAARPSQFNLLDVAHHPRSSDRLFVWTDADFPEYGALAPAAARRSGQFNTYRGATLVRSYFISAGQAPVVPVSLD